MIIISRYVPRERLNSEHERFTVTYNFRYRYIEGFIRVALSNSKLREFSNLIVAVWIIIRSFHSVICPSCTSPCSLRVMIIRYSHLINSLTFDTYIDGFL